MSNLTNLTNGNEQKKCNRLIKINDQNFCRLKIYLKLFEISYRVWNLETWIKSEKVLSHLKIYFKHAPCGVVPCVCIQVYHVIKLKPVWGACVKEIFRLDKTFSDLDFKTRFEISNKFKRILRHRSFEHYAHLIPYNLHSFFFSIRHWQTLWT